VRTLLADDVSLIATIHRSEHVDVQCGVVDGRLTEQPVTMADIPTWDPTGSGPHSVAEQVDFCASLIADGVGPGSRIRLTSHTRGCLDNDLPARRTSTTTTAIDDPMLGLIRVCPQHHEWLIPVLPAPASTASRLCLTRIGDFSMHSRQGVSSCSVGASDRGRADAEQR
jgi:hypothetical protein